MRSVSKIRELRLLRIGVTNWILMLVFLGVLALAVAIVFGALGGVKSQLENQGVINSNDTIAKIFDQAKDWVGTGFNIALIIPIVGLALGIVVLLMRVFSSGTRNI